MFNFYTLTLLLITLLTTKVSPLDNGLALTPPMGWMHWQRFRCVIDCQLYPDQCVSEELFREMADHLAADGYLQAGYEYIMIDDCWSSKERDAEGRLQADPERFPSGIKALADYVHNLGLKLGIYGDYGNFTCGGYPGSLNDLKLDAQTFADWEVDYLKFDGCYAETSTMEAGYGEMSEYLLETKRPIVFSCSFPAYKGLEANYSAAVEFCNLYRNYDDIQDSWASVQDIVQWFGKNQDFLTQYAGPGHWNDPDMLIIGDFGLSLEQSKSQMTIWSLLAAPLIMSVDLRAIEKPFSDIILNQDAIQINQDPLGLPGTLVSTEDNINVWMKKLTSGNPELDTFALGFVSFRTDGIIYRKSYYLSDFGVKNSTVYSIKDIFESQSKLNGNFGAVDEIVVHVKPSGAVFLLVTPTDVRN